MSVNFCILFPAEFKRPLQLAVSRTKRTLSRLRQLCPCIHDLDRALLKLDRVATSFLGDVDKLLGKIEVTIVVDTDLGNYVARIAFPYFSASYFHRHRKCS